jgi:hypothetical protein
MAPPGPTGLSAGAKYVAIAALTVVLGAVSYLSGHPGLTEDTLVGAAMVTIALAIQEFEGA